MRKRGLARRKYAEYLRSDLWNSIRARVLRRDGNRCQCCGARAECVHHRNYSGATLSGSRLDGLLALCGGCHESIHRGSGGKLLGVDATEAKLVRLLDLKRIVADVVEERASEVTDVPMSAYRRTLRKRYGLPV